MGNQLPSLHESSQNLNDSLHFGRQFFYDDWRFRPPIAGRTGDMTYGYHNGSLMVIVHLELRGIDGEPRKFCAEFKSLSPIIHNRPPSAGGQIGEAKLPLAHLTCNHIEQSVFVKVIEIAEQSEQGREGWVSSVVRLQSLDSCPHAKTQGFDVPELPSIFLGTVGNRKLQSAFAGGRVLARFADGDSIDEMIQSGPEVVNAISNDACPPIERRVDLDVLDEVAMAGTVSIDLLADDVRVAVNPSLEFSVEGVGVLLRSAEFEPAASKLRSEHTLILRS